MAHFRLSKFHRRACYITRERERQNQAKKKGNAVVEDVQAKQPLQHVAGHRWHDDRLLHEATLQHTPVQFFMSRPQGKAKQESDGWGLTTCRVHGASVIDVGGPVQTFFHGWHSHCTDQRKDRRREEAQACAHRL